MRLLLIFLLVFGSLSAKQFTFHEVHRMPKSVEKDYYIWRLLTQKSTTKDEANKIIREANSINGKLKNAYRRKTGKSAPYIAPLPAQHDWKRRSQAHQYFRYGLRFLQEGNPNKAHLQFNAALQHYIKRYDKDKSLFWLYLSTKNKKYVDALLDSHHINIYTLLAADMTGVSYPKFERPNLSSGGNAITNPIEWAKIKRKMKHTQNINNLANNYNTKESIGVYTYLKAKASNYKKSYFPLPYRETIGKLPINRQALIYAIARQESRFVPASVSRSFALGMMQFMPFLIKHIAKQRGERVDYDDIFEPKKSIIYANDHLNYLEKYLYHPLFIAYAYNGGIGFTKRHIKNQKYFRKRPYEPYMSLETMDNHEAREYGKKVLTNYVMYLNLLGKNTRILPLMQPLTNPKKTDRFR